MFERWNWKEADHVEPFRNEPFLAIDPGETGKVLAYEKGKRSPVMVAHPLQPEDVGRVMKATGARVLVVEAQYVRSLKASQSVLELTFKLGMCLGWVACTRAHVREMHMFAVAPASWQAHQRGHKGKPLRGEGIAIAMARAKQKANFDPVFRLWWEAEAKAGKEGLASALGIGDLWQHEAWDP